MQENNYPYSPPADTPAVQDFSARNLQAIKEFCRRPLVLILAIMFTVSAVFSLVSAFIGSEGAWQSLAQTYGIQYSQYQQLLIGIQIALLAVAVPALLKAVAFWMIHLRSKTDDPGTSPMAGFTILKVLAILEFVGIGILTVLFGLVVAVVAMAGESYSYTQRQSDFQMAAGILAFVMIIIVGVLVLYAVANLLFVNSFKNSMTTPQLQTKGIVLFGVLAVLSAVSSLQNLASGSMLNSISDQLSNSNNFYMDQIATQTMSPFSILSTIVTVGAAVCLAVFAFSYHSYAKKRNMAFGFGQGGVPAYTGGYTQQAPYYGQPAMPQPPTPMPPYGAPYPQGPQSAGPYVQPPSPPTNYSNPYRQPQQAAPPAPYAPLPYQPPQPPVNPYATPVPPPARSTPAKPAGQEGNGKACPACGVITEAQAEVCPYCGQKL